MVIVTEQAIGPRPHVQQIFGIRSDTAHDPEDALDEERRLHRPTIGKVRQIIKMPDVIAFELEART